MVGPMVLTAGAPGWDGSVYRTDDGRWRGVVDLGFVDGKRKRKYVSGPTQAEVPGKLRQAQLDADAGVVSDDRMTVGRFPGPMVDSVGLPGQVSGTTLDDYTHSIRLHLGPASGAQKRWPGSPSATWTSCGRPNGTPATSRTPSGSKEPRSAGHWPRQRGRGL